jgi:opacity protein-like surface antigen
MLKKLLAIGSIVAATTNVAFATGAPYVGVSTGLVVNTSQFLNYRGMPGTVFAGYGADLGQGFYLAGEVEGTIGTATVTDNGLKTTYNYGISILPGVLISDHTMGFARLGVVRSRFTPSGENNSTITGVAIGVGLQTSLTQNWDLRGEYTFISNQNISGVSGKPHTDETTLGLIYKFD